MIKFLALTNKIHLGTQPDARKIATTTTTKKVKTKKKAGKRTETG